MASLHIGETSWLTVSASIIRVYVLNAPRLRNIWSFNLHRDHLIAGDGVYLSAWRELETCIHATVLSTGSIGFAL